MEENSYKLLCIEIEQKRGEMILYGIRYGLTSLEVIQTSQQLDRLLDKLHYLNYPNTG
ncbi:aspartyl-phosphate phosphatase Spo0E family protein [Alteribacillus bidgolensis]|uniref:Spo0E like sporulation regulatory protein n=1 Tax=Alteribacillus bidgolensis TaxID=930129 RepID=A0A1G8RH29_9BACI|nr:aspartyl-phosphate phosphatase Spo0E family protein [Alteribacillus bidgolensis]SDJ15690.1 Spo0E like sporulation regulatory protein [Alteribacillus bidgolensis]